MNKVSFGIDTSNYATSFAVCGEDGEILVNSKKMLEVPGGARGLRQSDAVFHHTANAEFIAEQISAFTKVNPECGICAVGCSVSPRDAEGSYMPCFLVGRALASVIAASNSVPLYTFSHQAGHAAAALYGAGATNLIGKRFAAFHVSGGTTEVLLVTGGTDRLLCIEKIGGTKDLNAGQVIDRVGVEMGLAFPAGAEMERLAREYKGKIPKYPRAVHGLECNLSGIENKAYELYRTGGDKTLTAAFVINAVSDAISDLTDELTRRYPDVPVLYSGGVMSCSLIKERLGGDGRFFSPPAFSSDNAAGIAYLTMMKHTSSAPEV